MKTRLLIIIGIIVLAISGIYISLAYNQEIKLIMGMQTDTEPSDGFPGQIPVGEYYTIEITGLKDVYLIGEQYDFSYIISGYGHTCGSKKISFPDENGEPTMIFSSSSCMANVPMEEFVFDIQKEYGTTYGHIELKNPGTYTVTVTFDRPNQFLPTTVSQKFHVVDLEDPTSSYMGKIVPTLDDFRNTLNESQDIETIFLKFSDPHDDIGSGIHIYVYELNDDTQIWIGYTDHILYVHHVDSNGNLLEQLLE